MKLAPWGERISMKVWENGSMGVCELSVVCAYKGHIHVGWYAQIHGDMSAWLYG